MHCALYHSSHPVPVFFGTGSCPGRISFLFEFCLITYSFSSIVHPWGKCRKDESCHLSQPRGRLWVPTLQCLMFSGLIPGLPMKYSNGTWPTFLCKVTTVCRGGKLRTEGKVSRLHKAGRRCTASSHEGQSVPVSLWILIVGDLYSLLKSRESCFGSSETSQWNLRVSLQKEALPMPHLLQEIHPVL